MLAPGADEPEFQADILKTSGNAASFKIVLGENAGVLKLFDAGEPAKAAFERERKALDLFHGDQVPRLLFVAEAERAILTEFIKGTSFPDVVSEENLGQRAEFLGQWFGRMSNLAPSAAGQGSWATYLDQYKDGFDAGILHQQRPALEKTPVSKLLLSHNDNSLRNFILGNDKRLYAVDFEDCQMKPEGWDLVTAVRSLFGKFPGELELISASLLWGYQLGATNCGLPDSFDQVLKTLALAVSSVSDLDQVIAKIGENGSFDVILLDYNMPGMSGLTGLTKVMKANNGNPVALLSGTASRSVVEKAIELGAAGYLPKTMPAKSMVNADRFMAGGEKYVPLNFYQNAPETGGASNLTERERQVLDFVCEGYTNKEIANSLDLQEVTVKTHVKTMCHKLGAKNRTQAAMIAKDLLMK